MRLNQPIWTCEAACCPAISLWKAPLASARPRSRGVWRNPSIIKYCLRRRTKTPSSSALATQLFFLFQRSQKIADLRQSNIFEPVRVSDFLIDKDPLFARINLDPDEYTLYEKVFRQLTIDAPVPDLVIYLQATPDRLLERIQSRGIDSERRIDRDYLEQINEVYSEFFLYYDAAPLLIVNANELDLSRGDHDFGQLVDYLLDIRSGRHYFNPTFFG